MSKSLLYAANTNAQTLAPSSNVSFGNVVRRYGSNINLSNGNVIVSGCGYYGFDVNIVGVATGTGLVTATLLKNGTPITGATQTVTVGTTGDTISLSFPVVDRVVNCPCMVNTYTVELTGAITSLNVTNASIVVEKS